MHCIIASPAHCRTCMRNALTILSSPSMYAGVSTELLHSTQCNRRVSVKHSAAAMERRLHEGHDVLLRIQRLQGPRQLQLYGVPNSHTTLPGALHLAHVMILETLCTHKRNHTHVWHVTGSCIRRHPKLILMLSRMQMHASRDVSQWAHLPSVYTHQAHYWNTSSLMVLWSTGFWVAKEECIVQYSIARKGIALHTDAWVTETGF